jgi:hypothetical protein
MLNAEQRRLRAQIAANTRWAGESGHEQAVKAQAGLRARFEREVREAEPGLTDDEYARRAESAYRAHMGRIRLRATKARADRSGEDAA